MKEWRKEGRKAHKIECNRCISVMCNEWVEWIKSLKDVFQMIFANYIFSFLHSTSKVLCAFWKFSPKLKICIFKVKINKDECYFCLGRCSTKNCHKVSKLQSSQKHLKRDGWCQIYRWFLIRYMEVHGEKIFN